MPEEEKYAGSPSAQLAVRIIANLQAIAPDLPFLLSQRQLAEALGHSQHDSARFIIQKLQRDNLLECTHPGTRGANGLAAKWRYRGTLPSTASTPTPQENFAESPK
jgi:hypothetical protein